MKFKSAIFGFIAGAVTVATLGTAIGADTVVVGTLKPNISFKIDGNITKAPHSMTPINYNGYTYVPVRYISEMLGCNVEWNAYGDMVIVDFPEDRIKEVVREVEKIVYVDSSDKVDGTVYKTLPVRLVTSDAEINVKGITRDDVLNTTKVMLKVKNTESENRNIQLDQDRCVLIADGKEYNLTERVSYTDSRWYNNIRSDEEVEGYLTFDLVPEDVKEFTLKLVTTKNGKSTTSTINFIK